MKINLISDIHMEFANFSLKSFGEILAIAGDLGPVARLEPNIFKSFLKQISENYKHVIFVSGNHEYYGTTIENAEKMIKDYIEPFPNIYFLQCEKLTIDDEYEFFGCTLWSDLKGDRWLTNDGKCIENISMSKYRLMHKEHKRWLEEQLSLPRKNEKTKRIVMTHYLPSFRCIHDKYKLYGMTANSFYASDCEELIAKSDLWLFGHTHTPMKLEFGNSTSVICNPRGYPWEASESYKPLTIDI